MSKKAHETALPKLRFPEFRDAEAWEIKSLGSVAKLIKEKAGSKQYKLMSITSGEGLVSQIEKFGREIAGASYKNYYVIRKGDFAYNKSSTKLDPEGQIALLEKEEAGAVPNSIFTCFRVNEQIVSPYFLKYPFANNIHGHWLRDLITVGARVNGALSIDSKHLLALPLALPSLPEQQKVTAALSSLDALLTAQTAKLTALQAHKRGLMQDLFPAEGETVPKRRFPEFRDTGDWIERKLADVLFEHGSKSNGTEEVYSVSVHKGLINQIEHLGRSYSAANTSQYKKVVPGNIVYTKSPTGDFPFGIIKQSKIANTVIVSPLYGVFTPVNYALGSFIDLYFSSPMNTRRYLESIVQKGAKNTINISNGVFLSKSFLFPHNDDEAEKIADCLSSLDNLITAQTQKIDTLKLHKKGLMQMLFPTTDEHEA